MRKLVAFAIFLIGLLPLCNSYAVDDSGQQENTENVQAVEDIAPDAVYFLLGDLKSEEVINELEHPVADYSFGLGIEYIYNDYLNFRCEMLVVEREYKTPAGISGGPFTIVSEDMTMASLGFSLMPIVHYAVGSFELYAGAGFGFFWSKLTLTASTLGLPGTYEERSQDYGTQTLLGVGYHFDNSRIGLESRQLNLKVNMAPVTSAGDHDAGGDLLLLVYRLQF